MPVVLLLPAQNHGVIRGGEGCDNCRFKIIGRRERAVLDFSLLAAFPVIIGRHERAVRAVHLNDGIAEHGGKAGERWADSAHDPSLGGVACDDESAG